MEIYRTLASLRFQGRSQGLFNVEAKEVGILEVVLRFSVGPGHLQCNESFQKRVLQ